MNIQDLKGIGPKLLKHFNALGIYSVRDLLFYFPRDYEDRNSIKPLGQLQDGEFASIICEVSVIYPSKRTGTRKCINRIVFKNETGYIVGIWFNQPYIKNNFRVGEKVFLYGKISKKMSELQIIDPQYEKDLKNMNNGINPVYPVNRDLSQKIMRKIVFSALQHIETEISDPLPESIRKIYKLPDISTTIRNIHFPSNKAILKLCSYRIKFEELLILQLGLLLAKKHFSINQGAFPISISKDMKDFKESLPFELTKSQSKTIREILIDTKQARPMNRLVQGDVGSGKTIVAAIALFNCASSGYQGAMMAPTEILAEQHYKSITSLVERWGIRVALVTGGIAKKEKGKILKQIQEGEVDIVIGTHALIQENVEFKNLALVITDEQHRFGVRQRAELINKGHNPHVLIMTATPIPRTLALFMYGDMDISIINELPPGRQKIETYFINSKRRDRAYNFVKTEINNGRQAYVVCSLVEQSDKLEAESVMETADFLKNNYFFNYNVQILHGKMPSKEKEKIMNEFKEGKIDVLVSTTVIEVGVNVPNATVMVIEDAERFGLAQLHQLRGRVGRGSHKSHCILISEAANSEAFERLKMMTKTNDGFAIAEKDLEIRGTGEFFGTRQHGLPELKMADLIRDIDIVKLTRDISKELVSSNKIDDEDYLLLKKEIDFKFNKKFDDITFN